MHVIVVDAHDGWREAVISHLGRLTNRIEGLCTLADMHHRLQQDVPDILILDVNLPDGDALHHIAKIRTLTRRMGIVMLTRQRRSSDYVTGLTIGVDHYLAKPMVLAELAATVTALTRRIGLLDRADSFDTASWRYSPHTRQLTAPGGATIDLTDREGRLVSTLVTADSTPVTRNALVMALGASPASFDRHRLDTLIHRIRTKTRGHTPELQLRNVYGLGYACVTAVQLIGAGHRIDDYRASVT